MVILSAIQLPVKLMRRTESAPKAPRHLSRIYIETKNYESNKKFLYP